MAESLVYGHVLSCFPFRLSMAASDCTCSSASGVAQETPEIAAKMGLAINAENFGEAMDLLQMFGAEPIRLAQMAQRP